MKLPQHAAYGWANCFVRMNDKEIKSNLAARSESVSDPWKYVDENKHGVTTWRIYNYRATPMPMEEYGHFYEEDVFLILAIKMQPKPVERRIHVWVGKCASQTDYVAAFHFANLLDQKLRAGCTLHREVQGFESHAFRLYFNPVTYWNGKFEDSYWMKRVKREFYEARMLKLYQPSNQPGFLLAKQVPCASQELDPAFTFVLDTGKMLYLWHGNLTPTDEDLKTTRYVEKVKANRGCECQVEALDDDTEPDAHEFFTYLSRSGAKESSETDPSGSTLHRENTLPAKSKAPANVYELYKLKHDKRVKSLSVGFVKVKEQRQTKLSRKDLDKYSLCFYCTNSHVFIVMNKAMSKKESDIALQYGHDFLKENKGAYRAITVVRYKQYSSQLNENLL